MQTDQQTPESYKSVSSYTRSIVSQKNYFDFSVSDNHSIQSIESSNHSNFSSNSMHTIFSEMNSGKVRQDAMCQDSCKCMIM